MPVAKKQPKPKKIGLFPTETRFIFLFIVLLEV